MKMTWTNCNKNKTAKNQKMKDTSKKLIILINVSRQVLLKLYKNSHKYAT